jgi:trehalose 6-phosphate synthase/phosphatase
LFVGFSTTHALYFSRDSSASLSAHFRFFSPTNPHTPLRNIADMDQQGGAPEGARKADPAETAEIEAPRPGVPVRAESSFPPHLRPSVIEVPVTPGITRDVYESDKSDGDSVPGHKAEPGYFSRRDVDHAIAASPAPDTTNRAGQSFENKLETGAQAGADYMRRVSVAVGNPIAQADVPSPTAIAASTPSRGSMSDIRDISPDLALTGNIISATFNIPHSLKYRKGADWVSTFLFIFYFRPFSIPACPSIGPGL